MLNMLKEKNPELEIFSVYDDEFKTFGRVIENIDTSEVVKVGEGIEKPEAGVRYVPSLPEFEKLNIADEIKNKIFGFLPTEIGYCFGHSSNLNATEWHTSSEINIAVTPIVLILAHLWDITDEQISSSKFTAFYVPKGTIIEVYATTTHYCPCQVDDNGFGCVVGLPLGTNTALEEAAETKLMTAKNKWVIAHVENEPMLQRGVKPGISGVNYKIKY